MTRILLVIFLFVPKQGTCAEEESKSEGSHLFNVGQWRDGETILSDDDDHISPPKVIPYGDPAVENLRLVLQPKIPGKTLSRHRELARLGMPKDYTDKAIGALNRSEFITLCSYIQTYKERFHQHPAEKLVTELAHLLYHVNKFDDYAFTTLKKHQIIDIILTHALSNWHPDNPEMVFMTLVSQLGELWKAEELSKLGIPLGWGDKTYIDEWLDVSKKVTAMKPRGSIDPLYSCALWPGLYTLLSVSEEDGYIKHNPLNHMNYANLMLFAGQVFSLKRESVEERIRKIRPILHSLKV